MIEGIRESLARNLPDLQIRSLTKLGEGADNTAFDVNGELVLRARRPDSLPIDEGPTVRQESDLLAATRAHSTLPIPEIVFVDEQVGVLAYKKVAGVPLMERPVQRAGDLAAALGGFLAHLHRAPLAEMEEVAPRDADAPMDWHREAEGSYLAIVEVLSRADRGLVEGFLATTPPPPTDSLAFCHNDLSAEHMLVDPETGLLTGIIDWSDAAITDPVVDLALIFRDLGPHIFDLTIASYAGRLEDEDRTRAIFYARCALLEDIAWGLETGRSRYTEAGLAHLHRTFAKA